MQRKRKRINCVKRCTVSKSRALLFFIPRQIGIPHFNFEKKNQKKSMLPRQAWTIFYNKCGHTAHIVRRGKTQVNGLTTPKETPINLTSQQSPSRHNLRTKHIPPVTVFAQGLSSFTVTTSKTTHARGLCVKCLCQTRVDHEHAMLSILIGWDKSDGNLRWWRFLPQ